MGKKVTVQDIADALGISRNTVSKAINNTDGLADATREKILQKATEMGYKQFSYVSELSAFFSAPADSNNESKFQGEIALLTGSFLSHSHFAALVLDKFQQEISRLGYTMNTHRVTLDNFASKTLPATLQLEQIKGILCVEMFNWDYDEMLCGLDIPILFIDGPAKIGGRSLNADQLYMDNTTAISQFVHDMLAAGKTRIGFIGNYEHCQSFYERFLALYTSLGINGYTLDPRHIIKYNDREDLLGKFGEIEDFPDVYVCANDFVAWDAMQGMASNGKRVPEDVLICGFDDSAESRFCKPSMTTIHIHTQIIAYSAVHLLMTRIQEPSLDLRTVHTETELIYRESTKLN